MTDDIRRDREGIALAILIGVFVALVILLAVVLLARGTGGGTAATTLPGTTLPATTLPATTLPTTTLPPTTATTGPPATTTTTAAPTTTTTLPPATTTTTEPFSGDTDWKNCPSGGVDAGQVTDVRFAQREGYTRVVFDFSGGVPLCSVGYGDPHTLAVLIYPIDTGDAFGPGIFDGSGQLQIGTISVNRVSSGGMGGGSGEWEFVIDLAGTKRFHIFTLEAPSRLAIDIED